MDAVSGTHAEEVLRRLARGAKMSDAELEKVTEAPVSRPSEKVKHKPSVGDVVVGLGCASVVVIMILLMIVRLFSVSTLFREL